MRAVRMVLVIALFLALAAGGATATGGPVVVDSVRVEGLTHMSEERLLHLMGLREGGPMDAVALGHGISLAYKSGSFEYIEILYDEESPGDITVRVVERTFIRKVKVSGCRHVQKGFVLEWLGLEGGTEYRSGSVPGAIERLEGALVRAGFPEASVDIESRMVGGRSEVDLIVHVREGEPLRVESLIVNGVDMEVAAPFLSVTRGSILSLFRLEEDLEALVAHLRGQGYPGASVGGYRISGGTLRLDIVTGQRIVVHISGNDVVGGAPIREALGFMEDGEVTPGTVGESVARIQQLHAERGFYETQVAPVIERGEGVVSVSLFIHEGPRVLVRSVDVKGAEGAGLALAATLRSKPFLPYVKETVKEDVLGVKEFYAALGYKDAEAYDETRVEGQWADVTIRVEPGARYEIRRASVIGGMAPGYAHALTLGPGDPYNEIDISNQRLLLGSECRGRGFPECRVDVRREFDGLGVGIFFIVREGEMAHFGKTVVRGNRMTRDSVILGELPFEEGTRFDRGLLIEARRNLYRLGLFSRVDVEVIGQAQGVMEVLVEVREGLPGSVEFGVGYGEYERERGFVGIGYSNLFGLNRQGSVRLEASTVANLVQLGYVEPRFWGTHHPARFNYVHEQKRQKNIDTGETMYRSRKDSASVALEYRLDERTLAALTYEFSVVDTYEVDPGVVLTKEDTGTIKISSLTPSVAFDTRDNPFDPTEGIFAGASLKAAAGLIFSEADFLKFEGYARMYGRLGSRVVLAGSVRGGWAEGYAGTSELPLVERFFLGGRSTVRGFDQDSLGPTGEDGSPTGGDVYLVLNAEARLRVIKGWRLVGFVDAGQVWVDLGGVDIGELRASVGLGLQYDTPVGPIRLDYGHKLDREEGESSGEVHFSLGHAF